VHHDEVSVCDMLVVVVVVETSLLGLYQGVFGGVGIKT
jgi:hypothetical protein